MAKNDTVLIDGIINERIAKGVSSGDRGEVFEYLVLEQFLKNFDLSQEDIESGWVDGRNDGGIDGLYIFINGRLILNNLDLNWPKKNANIEVYILSCKHHDTFREATVNSLIASVQEIFDLSKDAEALKGVYSKAILEGRSRFSDAYRRVAIAGPDISFNVIYASRGDADSVGESVKARADQIVDVISRLFSNSTAVFQFIGSKEIIQKYREQKQFTLELPFIDHLSGSGEGYIAVVQLDRYFEFISDENGTLRRYLFDSNVRDYLGLNKVNDDIAMSLLDEAVPDFWWLNNGVTILATKAVINGKTILLQDIQIVNGLQTTETVYNHFRTGTEKSKLRSIVVKIVVSKDDGLRDQIIRATNNQTAVEQSALHATDKIQRDIEQILEKNDWYYERRRNYYRNIGKPLERFVTPMFLAAGYVALGMKNPAAAASLKSRFMRNEGSYEAVFSEGTPIEVWPRIVEIVKMCEEALSFHSRGSSTGERFLKSWRGLVALLFVAKQLGGFSYSMNDLVGVILSDDSMGQIKSIVGDVLSYRSAFERPSIGLVNAVCRDYGARYGLLGFECVGRQGLRDFPPRKVIEKRARKISEEFISQVNLLLPSQPWGKGVHIEVADKLGCKNIDVTAAIQILISRGLRHDQVNGVIVGLA